MAAHARSLSTAEKPGMSWLIAAVLLGVALRAILVIVAGNRLIAPWSGGGDMHAYVALAQSVTQGKGLGYAGQPSAFRAPLYPLFLAWMMWLFGGHYIVAVRWIQLAASLAMAFLCWRTARRLFGEAGARISLIVALFLPTLVYFTGEVLTECFAALLAASYVFFLVEGLTTDRLAPWAGAGLAAGAAALLRFNMPMLVPIAVWAAFRWSKRRRVLTRMALAGIIPVLMIAPWIVRNEIVFHGLAAYSTLSGGNAAYGIISPQGRAQASGTEKIRATLGWTDADVETNDPSRLRLPSEPELNRQAWSVARRLWLEENWRLIPLAASKLLCFWLSTDQVFSTHNFSAKQRLARLGGVVAYWIALIAACIGWLRLRKRNARIASVLLLYALALTALHLPFVMNTRLRAPLMDPLLAILAGGSVVRGTLANVSEGKTVK